MTNYPNNQQPGLPTKGFIVIRVVDLELAGQCVTDDGAAVWGPLTSARVHMHYDDAKRASQIARGLVCRWPFALAGLAVNLSAVLQPHLTP